MQLMTEPVRIFIRCQPEWSFRYIGGIKDFIPIDLSVIEHFYGIVNYYTTLRHNFINGHTDNLTYAQDLEQLRISATDNYPLWEYVLWECETLYRQLRPFLNNHSVPIEKTSYVKDDRGEVLGFVVYLRQSLKCN